MLESLFSFLDIRTLFNVAFCNKAIRARVTHEAVVRSAVLSGGAASEDHPEDERRPRAAGHGSRPHFAWCVSPMEEDVSADVAAIPTTSLTLKQIGPAFSFVMDVTRTTTKK